MEYRIREKVTDLITKLYPGDKVRLTLDETKNKTVPVTRGSRQQGMYRLHSTLKINTFENNTEIRDLICASEIMF